MKERIETTIMSSRGQIVIPMNARRTMDADEGTIFAVIGNENTLILKKIDMPSKEKLIEETKEIENGRKELNIKKIIKILRKNKEEIKMYAVKRLGVFGSFLKEKQKKESDIDVLVKFERNNFDNFMGLKLYLEKLFNKKVDLIIERSLKPELKYVKKEAQYVKY